MIVSGRIHKPSTLRPWKVPTGWVIAWSTWVRDPEFGWDEEIEPIGEVRPTEEACLAAIELMRARAQ